MTFWKWSRTAANNATADSTCPFPEGMAPSALNDGTRGMMAAAAKYRDDISGALVTTGTSTAYAISSNQGFDSLPHMDGAMIAFTPHATNGAGPVTLNVDGLGVQPLRTAPGVELLSGVLIQGTPYVAFYRNADNAFYLQGGYGNPYNVPLGASLDYWALVAPNSSFAFPNGQAISRTTYSALFNLIGTLYGAGNGTTTFNLPNKTGRASVMRDPGGTQISGAVFTSLDLGGVGGNQLNTLNTANLPPYTPSGSVSGTISGSAFANFFSTGTGSQANVYSPSTGSASPLPVSGTFFGSLSGNAQGGTSTPFSNVQPSIVCNCIMRII
ncbi:MULTISPECIES: phage tail protein [unclassified Bradyrhizobium]|uniref:phage tail protein n=1 Tax=unclassified Bradyrhizobium TaxID=2631580 RepID=UPI001BA51C3D|nr:MULTISPECIES: tail fiber protein [unclassified Bradyrhizobium]MBR1206623.1 tail fiber protein [Bradyrhizobium sp. AUGA SZCCT0124]MBR1315399.1 tail fiber protein [Bradyrhizobium sp. AUGA SZCCT0051]MBR1338539.1 tail fiber protein [Bradyrhizobium sp. AUGA SZCCT0105]MBR1356194.1 tail fiber protein [Bradyrhizobium sp. AUGA SZCCT0045]